MGRNGQPWATSGDWLPGRPWHRRPWFPEAAELFHDSKNVVFKAAYSSARDLFIQINKGERIQAFSPATHVRHTEARVLTVFVDLGFLTESEVTRLTQLSAKTLKLGKPTKLTIEDGSVLQGYPVSLRGVPATELPHIRKIRVEHRILNTLEETLMAPKDHIRQEQARELWQLACERQEEAAPSGVKAQSRHNLTSFEGIASKAAEIMQDLSDFSPLVTAFAVSNRCKPQMRDI